MPSVTDEASATLTDVSPDELAEWLDEGSAVLVDVREDNEHASERIEGAVLAPLSRFDPDAIHDRFAGSRVVFHCRSGMRSVSAAKRYAGTGEDLYHLVGGIQRWKAAGHGVVGSGSVPCPLSRPIRIGVLMLAALNVVLGVAVSPWFIAFAVFLGFWLVLSSVGGRFGPAGTSSCASPPDRETPEGCCSG